MKQRIQKVLAAAGVDSRRHIEQMVEQGRVSINGATRTRLPILVDPDSDVIRVDGEVIRTAGVLGRDDAKGRRHKPARLFYLMLNKPRGVYSTNVAQGAQTRAIDLLPENFPARVFPVGRLDADSRGLLLLTNDGDLTHLLTHPRFGVPKTYRATIDGFVPPEHMEMLEQGLYLVDRDKGKTVRTGRSVLRIRSRTRQRTVLDITIKEGKNRQIRRMLARLGHKVRDLNRTRFGPLELEKLPLGAVRPLTPDEVRLLRGEAEKVKAFFERRGESAGPGSRGGGRGPRGAGTGPRSPGGSSRGGGAGSRPVEETADFLPDEELDDD